MYRSRGIMTLLVTFMIKKKKNKKKTYLNGGLRCFPVYFQLEFTVVYMPSSFAAQKRTDKSVNTV